MRYAYILPAVFAATVVSSPIPPETDLDSRSDGSSNLIGDIGLGTVIGGDGAATGVKNAKRDEENFVGGGSNEYNDGHLLNVGTIGALKRSENIIDEILEEAEGLIPGTDTVTDLTDKASDLGSLTDLVKRSEKDLIGDIGAGTVVGGDGDGTGVKNAKHDTEDFIGPDGAHYADEGSLLDVGPLINVKRSVKDLIGDIGAGTVVGGDGNGVGVKNAKRDNEELIGSGSTNSYGGGLINLGPIISRKRSEENFIGDIGAGTVIGGDGDGTGVKNAKRDDQGLIDGDGEAYEEFDDGDGLIGPLISRKRSDEDLIGDIGAGTVIGGDGDGTGVKNAKREEELLDPELVGFVNPITVIKRARSDEDLVGDIGLAFILGGKGDATGVKNSKREEDVGILSATDSGLPVIDVVRPV